MEAALQKYTFRSGEPERRKGELGWGRGVAGVGGGCVERVAVYITQEM